MDTRRGKEDYYLDIADAVLNRSTCLRRKYGAIICLLYTSTLRRAGSGAVLRGLPHGTPSSLGRSLCAAALCARSLHHCL